MGRVAGDFGEDYGIGVDTGCQHAPSCLNCPFPVCKDDDPGWFVRNAKSNTTIGRRCGTLGVSEH